jgi:hypothetical protein
MLIGFEGVTADKLGEAIGLMRGCGAYGPHFPEDNVESCLCDLPRCFGTCESAACDVYQCQNIIIAICASGVHESLPRVR